MFRSLRAIFPPGRHEETEPVVLQPPVAVTSTMDAEEADELPEVTLQVTPEGVFSTTVGPPAKKTLAGWHVTSPEEVVDAMEHLLEN
jgi:trehalose 6-phosphate synthase/phosphatase